MATGESSILGIPEKVSPEDRKVAEQLKQEFKELFTKPGSSETVPEKKLLQYAFTDKKWKGKGEPQLDFEPKLPTINSDWPSLVTASFQGDVDRVKQLLRTKCDVNVTANDRVSALLAASFIGHTEVVKLLLDHGAKVNISERITGGSALMAASQYGHHAIAKLLLTHGALPNMQKSTNITALMLASYGGHYGIVKLLLEKGAKPNIQEQATGLTALLLAVTKNYYSIAELLLKSGSEVDVRSMTGRSGLMFATIYGFYDMVNLLLDYGAQARQLNSTGESTLTLASQNGNYEVATLLLKNGAHVVINSRCKHGLTALMEACHYNHYEIAKLLLNHGANPNLKNLNGTSALMGASFQGHRRITRLLLQKGAKLHLRDKNGQSALHIACIKGHYLVAEFLLRKGAHINLQDKDGATPLMVTCIHSHCDIVELLLENGAEIDQQGARGASALMLATEAQHYDIVKLLLQNGAQSNLQGTRGIFALLASATMGHFDLTKLLINKGALVDLKTAEGVTSLQCASWKGNYEIVNLLLKRGARPNTQDLQGFSALMRASREGKHEVAKLLLDHGALPNMQDCDGNSSLLHSLRKGCEDVIELLLARGAQPSLWNQGGHSTLKIATVAGHYEIIQLLLEAQVDRVDLWHRLKTAVHMAMEIAIIELLLKRCLQVIRKNEVLVVDSGFPGVVFWGPPIQQCITSQGGATIQPPHTGISLSIPEQALSPAEKDVDLLIHPCFSGPFELPAGYESASPAYLIQPSRKVEIQRDVTLQIHHYASLQSEEDCEEMTFLSASPVPQYQQSKLVYVFREIKQSTKGSSDQLLKKGRVDPVSSKLDHSKENCYSARLYRVDISLDISAVFCMCLCHPLYKKHCDDRITEEYALSSKGEARSDCLVHMKADEVTLSVRNTKGWNVTFDRSPLKIRRRDVDFPELLGVDVCKLTDYPPKFLIFVHPTCEGIDSDSPQLVVEGLDVEDFSFEILTPGSRSSRRSASFSPSSPSDSRSTSHSLSSQASVTVAVTADTEEQKQLVAASLGTSDLYKILTELRTAYKEWKLLGLALGLEYPETDEIEGKYPHSIKNCMAEVIARWLRSGSSQLSWRTLWCSEE